jgi:hypothetical protein
MYQNIVTLLEQNPSFVLHAGKGDIGIGYGAAIVEVEVVQGQLVRMDVCDPYDLYLEANSQPTMNDAMAELDLLCGRVLRGGK